MQTFTLKTVSLDTELNKQTETMIKKHFYWQKEQSQKGNCIT